MPADEEVCKLAAVMQADVKGYSRLINEDESATVRSLPLPNAADYFQTTSEKSADAFTTHPATLSWPSIPVSSPRSGAPLKSNNIEFALELILQNINLQFLQ